MLSRHALSLGLLNQCAKAQKHKATDPMPEITIPKLPDGYDAEIEIKPDGSMKIKLTKSSVVQVPIAAPEPPVKTIPLPVWIPHYEPPKRFPDVDFGPWWEVTCEGASGNTVTSAEALIPSDSDSMATTGEANCYAWHGANTRYL